MKNGLKSLAISNLSYVLSQTNIQIDYSITPGAFEILTNYINDPNWVDNLLDHGCWCAKLDPDKTSYGLGGRSPVDELDTICKQWAQSRSCTRFPGGSCENYPQQSGFHYDVDYVYGLEDSICPDNDTCLSETCQIDLFFVKQIVDWKTSNNDILVPVDQPVCDFGGASSGLQKHCAQFSTTVLPITTLAQCSCSNGQGTTGADCPSNGQEKCENCNSGYYLYQDTCIENSCTCENGIGAIGEDCISDGSATCASCNPGHYLLETLTRSSVYTCPENVCTCQNGVGTTNTNCPENGNSSCASCNSGYFLNADSCSENVCTCQNGAGSVNTACPNNGDSSCASCNTGYYLNGSTCEMNQCTCASGTPATVGFLKNDKSG